MAYREGNFSKHKKIITKLFISNTKGPYKSCLINPISILSFMFIIERNNLLLTFPRNTEKLAKLGPIWFEQIIKKKYFMLCFDI